jgi:hypothetical protein
MICEVFAWLNFVEFFFEILKFVGCSKFMLNFNKFNNHSNLTINVIEFVFYLFIVKLQFKVYSTNIDCLHNFLFFVLIKCSLILKLLLLLNFMNMSNLKIYFIE